MSVEKWLKQNAQSLDGKTIAISGSTGGIGNELCKILASLGAKIICLDRNAQKVEALKQMLLKDFPSISKPTTLATLYIAHNIA